MTTGGIIAVHASHRDRIAIGDAVSQLLSLMIKMIKLSLETTAFVGPAARLTDNEMIANNVPPLRSD